MRTVVASADQLGEGPVWHAVAGALLWVDILCGRAYSWSPHKGVREIVHVKGELSAVVPRVGGGLLLAVGHELIAIDDRCVRETVAIVEDAVASNRFNDCRCDPQGRLWAGTMSKLRATGAAALYRLSAGCAIERAIRATTISNGLGWSPSGDRMYFVDSPTQRIDVFDFDSADGSIADRRTFASVPARDGMPDGLAVDAEGGVWVCLFGGGAVQRYTSAGELEETIRLPVTNPTCPAFGGPRLETLFITTARQGLTAAARMHEPLAGCLLALEPGVAGLAATPFCG